MVGMNLWMFIPLCGLTFIVRYYLGKILDWIIDIGLIFSHQYD